MFIRDGYYTTPVRGLILFLQGGLSPVTYKLKKTVVLVGMMGCGKTSVGRALARKLSVPFCDSDEEIERASNYTIPELFSRFGEVFFREKETQVLTRLLKGPPQILSTGGGSYMQHINRVIISEYGVALWVRAEVNLLWARVKGKSHRPLLQTDDPYQTLKEINHSRAPIYAQAPLHVTAFSTHSINDTAQLVVRELLRHPEILEKTHDPGNPHRPRSAGRSRL